MGIIQFVSYNQPHLQGYKDDRTYLGLTVALKKTRHLTQTKGKSLDEKRFYSKNVREDLLRTLNT